MLDWLAFRMMDVAGWLDGDMSEIYYDHSLAMRLDGTWASFWDDHVYRWRGWRPMRYV